ncbi:HobA family DNA replication regulator [Helicobacter cappadocius]|uniref:HobA family DNA replication regulator n=1 Tax=Helicobacter cappadocius TaxID=3063998 RepID=A0AA90PJZ4_9HELI|nr:MULTISPECIES: HobA family DNA replication regulator [unclassified Helicobacter]MDO7253670.1 HobA family DNA replication regulator [Helicobacter sp. faydin-H75]MDP2539642.1 HobA family DNA replication regulator [Helicobacter sp. faydin-H76]
MTAAIEISDWMLKAIREESESVAMMSGWLEMERYQWVSMTSRTIGHILNGGTLLVCTDEDRQWFGKYIVSSINRLGGKSRPILPVFNFTDLLPKVFKENSLINDALDISYKDYMFWYIGKTGNPLANLAFSRENGFFWIFDDSIQDGLTLSSLDTMIDYKLIQLFRIFEKTLFDALFGKIILE